MNNPLPLPDPCAQCPSKRKSKNGIILNFFGSSICIDPVEMCVLITLFTTVGINIQDARLGKLTFRESIERIVMLSAVGAIARMSPTEQVSEFLSKFSFTPINK